MSWDVLMQPSTSPPWASDTGVTPQIWQRGLYPNSSYLSHWIQAVWGRVSSTETTAWKQLTAWGLPARESVLYSWTGVRVAPVTSTTLRLALGVLLAHARNRAVLAECVVVLCWPFGNYPGVRTHTLQA